jgi:hypothetical protein
MQTQIVEDLRIKYDPKWKRRDLWDRMYHEAFRPNVPSVLLELLSHQNFLDMKFFHDPGFRFDVSRAIYKSMLRFIATQNNQMYTVQPLPVSHFQSRFTAAAGTVQLDWKPVLDPLEPSARPQKYCVYTRIDSNDFHAGQLVDSTRIILNGLKPGTIYSYKVTAVNDGGESFPSEILSVCWLENAKETVLIVNAFDRVSAPAYIETDKFSGFLGFLDQGVPDRYDLGYTGLQFNFTPASKWLDDDAPGFGASYADCETRPIPGNTFDFPFLHGQSIKDCGYSFVSCSDEAVMDGGLDLPDYYSIDLLLGEEKTTSLPRADSTSAFKAFPPQLQRQITRYCQAGGNLFLSGSYIGSDLHCLSSPDSADIKFAWNVLKYKFRTDHAVRTGKVQVVDPRYKNEFSAFEFNTVFHPSIYAAEAPEAIEPYDRQARTILRYGENNMSAAVAYQGTYSVVAFGFPFETILNPADRHNLMRLVFRYFRPPESP